MLKGGAGRAACGRAYEVRNPSRNWRRLAGGDVGQARAGRHHHALITCRVAPQRSSAKKAQVWDRRT